MRNEHRGLPRSINLMPILTSTQEDVDKVRQLENAARRVLAIKKEFESQLRLTHPRSR